MGSSLGSPELAGEDPVPADSLRRIEVAGPLRHRHLAGRAAAGSHFEEVAGVPCAAFSLPWAWGTQASLTAVPDTDLIEVASQVVEWLDRHSAAGWQLEVDTSRARLVCDALELDLIRELDVMVSVAGGPSAGVAGEVSQPRDEDEFLAIFGPELAPMIVGQLTRPDWELGVLRELGEGIGCYRLMDLADTTYLGGVTVVPARRGQGVGRALSAYATRRARRRSDLVWLQCEPGLAPFYTALGYRMLGRSSYLGPSDS